MTADTLERLRDALSKAYDDLPRARALAELAGIPRDEQPIDQLDMRGWWWETQHIAWKRKALVTLVEKAAADPDASAWQDTFEDLHNAVVQLQAQPAPARLREPTPPSAPRISLTHLPETGPDLFGREEELALLDAAWASGDVGASGVGAIHESPLPDAPSAPPGKTNVVTLVAVGGTGKTALAKHWLARMAAEGFRGATHVLGWSFYSQGAREDGGASADPFIDYGLRWFGDDDPARGSPWEKGERLAGYFAVQRSLLVLDGMEPLQYRPGVEHAGRVRDPALAALLRTLAYGNAGLCIVTTREPVSDVAECVDQTVIERDLRHLPRKAAITYLRKLGVTGEEDELAEAAKAFGGHALALTLLGTLLRDFCGGDVRRWREAGPLEEEPEKGPHAGHVMAAYERWLGEGPERAILRMVGLFDRPASAGALDALRATPPVPGLTDRLFDPKGAPLAGRVWDRAVLRLRKARLLEPQDPAMPGALDAHPLVREHFAAVLQDEAPDAWREGHSRLYDFYCKQAPDLPDTLSQMAPLFAAVGHGCKAGRRQETLDDVYWRRTLRGNEHFSWKKLGSFSSDLAALAGFFERTWYLPAAELMEPDRGFVLNQAGLYLRALGRASEAEGPMRAGLEMRVAQGNWKNAAIVAGNLSELALSRGDVAGAVRYAEQAVAHADKSGDAFLAMLSRTFLADARAQAGVPSGARALFEEAERRQAERQPEYRLLYSLQGYQYCDLLLDAGEYAEVLRRATQAIRIAEINHWLLDIALDHLSLGRAYAALREWPDARRELDAAVAGLRVAGQQDYLERGVLARAALRREMGTQVRSAQSSAPSPAHGRSGERTTNEPSPPEFAAARRDLDEATRIAVRSGFRLHEADARLEWARLYLAEGDPQAAHASLDAAKVLVEETGYHRRDAAVAALEEALREAG